MVTIRSILVANRWNLRSENWWMFPKTTGIENHRSEVAWGLNLLPSPFGLSQETSKSSSLASNQLALVAREMSFSRDLRLSEAKLWASPMEGHEMGRMIKTVSMHRKQSTLSHLRLARLTVLLPHSNTVRIWSASFHKCAYPNKGYLPPWGLPSIIAYHWSAQLTKGSTIKTQTNQQ